MTNSASEPGGEDVLASIRRLILATPAAGSSSQVASSRASSEPAPPQGDRLLLTPALRVAEPGVAEPAPATLSVPRGLTLEDRIAELEAAVGSQVQEFEPDGSEVAHVRPPEDLVRAVENLRIETLEAEHGQFAQPEGGEADDAAPTTPAAVAEAPADADDAAAGPAAAPEVRRGLFLAVPPQPQPPSEAFVDVPAQASDAPMPAGLFFTRHDRASEEDATEDAGVDEAGADANSRGPQTAAGPDEAPAADSDDLTPELRAILGDAHEAAPAPFSEVETPDVEADLPRFRPAFRHSARLPETVVTPPADMTAGQGGTEPEVATEVAPEVAPEVATDAGLDMDWRGSEPSDAATVAVDIDEDRLRALVAELLHEELQGPLGEKITRNIRKLVRREIERALAVRDFD